ncbi:hypothetical protein KCP76_24810 [Salmonella enterica subsp. enterica serovar Weltevreden]|nr:hypothetical protein KCP76_24810 [Salmonella enterica subsp. enterica serovar Weltevreden]
MQIPLLPCLKNTENRAGYSCAKIGTDTAKVAQNGGGYCAPADEAARDPLSSNPDVFTEVEAKQLSAEGRLVEKLVNGKFRLLWDAKRTS